MTLASAIDSSTRRRSASCARLSRISMISISRRPSGRPVASRALAIRCRELALGSLFQAADGGDDKAHGAVTGKTTKRLLTCTACPRDGANPAAPPERPSCSSLDSRSPWNERNRSSSRAAPAGYPTTSSRDCRRRGPRGGRRERSHRSRRSAPSRNAERLRPARQRRALCKSSTILSATEPTWRCDRPEETTM